MSQSTKSDHISESTIARIAGNILSGMQGDRYWKQHPDGAMIAVAVDWARQIAAEVQRTANQSPAPAAQGKGEA